VRGNVFSEVTVLEKSGKALEDGKCPEPGNQP